MSLVRQELLTINVPSPSVTSFEDLFVAHYPDLMRFAIVFTGDRTVAEDVVAEVFARLLTRRSTLAIDDMAPYLRRCVVNETRSLWRRQERRTRLAPKVTHSPSTASDTFTGAVDERSRVLAAIARLSPRQRAVIVLRFYEDLSEAEIAELLDIAVGTVKSTLATARQRLSSLLEGA